MVPFEALELKGSSMIGSMGVFGETIAVGCFL